MKFHPTNTSQLEGISEELGVMELPEDNRQFMLEMVVHAADLGSSLFPYYAVFSCAIPTFIMLTPLMVMSLQMGPGRPMGSSPWCRVGCPGCA